MAGRKIRDLNRFTIMAFSVALITCPLWSQEPTTVSTSHGYLFIDGQYVPPPYDFQWTTDTITVNDRQLGEVYFDVAGFEREFGHPAGRSGRRPGMHRGRRSRGSGAAGSRMADIANQLQQSSRNGVVVLYRQEHPLLLYAGSSRHRLLSELVGKTGAETAAAQQLSVDEQECWNRLVSEFQPSDDFITRANVELQAAAEVAREGERAVAANRFVAKISYPLTVFAMILVVLAFGHLLQNRPDMDPNSEDLSIQNRVVVRSLVLIALLSSIDLIWTLAATNAGAMAELNPLGSRFIGDPAQLVLFKLAVTAAPIGILYVLHRRPVAQIASWWCCLLLTLLTARWVVFQSMFV